MDKDADNNSSPGMEKQLELRSLMGMVVGALGTAPCWEMVWSMCAHVEQESRGVLT